MEFVVPDNIFVDADPGLMRIVMENLVRNSWKFTSKKPHALIEFLFQKKEESALYGIRDNGAGLDMTKAGKLFTPFTRLHTEEEVPGTGIGLAIVRRIIERHGGKIWAEGEAGKGASIYFELPDNIDTKRNRGGRSRIVVRCTPLMMVPPEWSPRIAATVSFSRKNSPSGHSSKSRKCSRNS